MGKLVIADLMMGNDDRIHAVAMNVGNMMVSSMKGAHKLVAIDSRAVLGGQFKPEEVLKSGSVSGSQLIGGFGSTKKTLDKPPVDYVDGFFTTLKSWMLKSPQGERTAPENTLDPGDVLWDTYQARKAECVQAFASGWQEGLERVRELASTKEGRARMKEVVGSVQDDPGKEQVNYTTLKINAMYLGGGAGGKTHEDAAPRPAQYAAIKWLKQFDPESIRLPRDEFFWDVARPPKGEVLTGDVSGLGDFLPIPAAMNVMGALGTLSVDQADMAKLGTKIAAIKSELEGMTPKTKGLLSKREVTRNRVVVAKWLADCYLLGAGTRRAIDRVRQMDDTARFLELAVGGPMSAADAKALMTPAMMIRQYHKTLTRHLESYVTSVNEVILALNKVKRYGKRGDMLTTLGKLVSDAGRALERHANSPRLQNPQVYEHALSGSMRG